MSVKVIQLYEKLSLKEKSDLVQFLIFQNKTGIIDAFSLDFFCNIIELETEEDLELFLKKSRRISKNKVNKILNLLIESIESYIAFNEVKSDKLLYSKTLFNYYSKQNKDSLIGTKKHYSRFDSLVKNSNHINRLSETEVLYQFDSILNLDSEIADVVVRNKEKNDLITALFLKEKFRIFVSNEQLKVYFDKQDSKNELEQQFDLVLVQHYEENDSLRKKYPEITIYFDLFHLVKTPSKLTFNKLWVSMLESHNFLSHDDLLKLCFSLMNYCLLLKNKEPKYFAEKVLEINDFVFNNKLIETTGLIHHAYMKIVVEAFIQENKSSLAYDFLNKIEIYIRDKYCQNMFNYCKALLLFENKKLVEALICLQNVKFIGYFFSLSVRALIVKIHYELDSDFLLERLIRKDIRFLKRDKSIHKYHFNLFMNFYKTMLKLISLKSINNKSKLLVEINKFDNVYSKEWLLDKCRKK